LASEASDQEVRAKGVLTSKPHHAYRQKQQFPQRGSPSCCHNDKNDHSKAKYFREKLYKPKEIHIYEGLVYMMKNVLLSLEKLDMAYNPTSQVKKV
jgi:hypothetical protein